MAEGTPPAYTNAVPIAEELEVPDIAPPAYGEHHDQLQFSQAGFAADAAVTDTGRVNIHINEKNQRLSELLAPALKRQLRADQLPSGPLPPPYIPPSLGGLPGQTPPPRLNVVIQIVGSRGDVQPFIALGQVLRDTYGHRVRLATHATFRSFVEENGLEFFNIGGDPAELMAFMVKNPGLMPGLETLKSGEIKKRRQEIHKILMGCWRSCIEAGDGMGPPVPQHRRDAPLDDRFVLPPGDPAVPPFVADAIIANPPSFAHIHVAEKLGIPLHMMFTMPWTPTRAFPHPLADIVATNADVALTNYVSYALVEMMTWQGLGDVINRFRTNILELDPISLLWAPGLLSRLRVPTTYCWSPALTPKPVDWAPEISVSGFYFLDLETSYTPEPDLAAFLAAGPPPVYIGFGSIVVDDPDALTHTIFNAVIKSGVRALVSKGWGGIGGDAAGIPEGVFMLGNCPHDWLFRRVSAVVHHGGAGTTAAGIKAGCPTVVVPFFGDQIFWGSMVARAGAGPAPITYKTLTADNLAAAIEEALRPETMARARELGEKIKEEKGADVGGKSFHQFLNTDDMRCSLAPSRVAVWRARRSKIRLSALAAAVLVDEGKLKYSDLKLYRPVEYNTEEQPWDPVSAVTMGLVGDIGALTMAMADFPREVFKARAKKENVNAVPKDGAAKTEETDLITSTGLTPVAGPSSHQRATSLSRTSTGSWPGSTANTSVDAFSPSTLSSSTLSPQPTPTSTTPSTTTLPPPPPLSRGNSSTAGPSNTAPSTTTPNPVNLEVAMAAGTSAARIVEAGFKFPKNFCLGLARGFRNAPKLYNDETVRPAEKVTGFTSGMKVAGKEFGLGMYDGVSGLITQPWKAVEKEGGRGLWKGVGKGIGGLILKPAAAVWAIPAYTMQGVHAEVRGLFARSSVNYIIGSRVAQGEGDLKESTVEERRDVLARWGMAQGDLKGFYLLRQREEERERERAAAAAAAAGATVGGVPELPGDEQQQMQAPRLLDGRTVLDGVLATSGAGWKKLQQRNAMKRAGHSRVNSMAGGSGSAPPTTASSASSGSVNSPFDDHDALERAIQQSVVQTSTGDREEDARIEAAVRASVMQMRRVAELEASAMEMRQAAEPEAGGWPRDYKSAAGPGASNVGGGVPHWGGEKSGLTDEEWTNISDEEYQALIEEAVKQSLVQQQLEQQRWGVGYDHPQQQQQQQQQWGVEKDSGAESGRSLPSEDIINMYELPGDLPTATATTNTTNTGPAADDNNDNADEEAEALQLRLAMAESEREHRDHAANEERQRAEEEIVLEYVKKQSLAEEEYRRARAAAKGKGVLSPGSGGGGDDDDGEDEDLRRALEESLRMSGGGGSGGFGASGSGLRRGG